MANKAMKQSDALKILVFALMGLMVIVGAVMFLGKPGGQPETAGNATGAANGTANQLNVARWGDNVTLDYWLYDENGTLMDTSVEQSARDSDIFVSYRQYAPLELVLNSDNGMIPGFTNGILGASVGVKKRFTVQPADGYGERDPGLVQMIGRTYMVPRIEEAPLSTFQKLGMNVTENGTIRLQFWNATVLSIINGTVTVRHEPSVGQIIETSNFPEKIIAVNETNITISLEPEVGDAYTITNPDTGMPQRVEITAVDNESVTVDFNHPLAGKLLTFDIIVRSINP
jgi:FKBP-type peptidyl-prolyl cis-trans isomerase 2